MAAPIKQKRCSVRDGLSYPEEDKVVCNVFQQNDILSGNNNTLQQNKLQLDFQNQAEELNGCGKASLKLDLDSRNSVGDVLPQKGILRRSKGRKKRKNCTVSCEICGAKLYDKYNLKRHCLEVHDRGIKLNTKKKGKSKRLLKVATSLKNITIQRDKVRTIERKSQDATCNKCSITFGDVTNLKRHIQTVHEGIMVISKSKLEYLKREYENIKIIDRLTVRLGEDGIKTDIQAKQDYGNTETESDYDRGFFGKVKEEGISVNDNANLTKQDEWSRCGRKTDKCDNDIFDITNNFNASAFTDASIKIEDSSFPDRLAQRKQDLRRNKHRERKTKNLMCDKYNTKFATTSNLKRHLKEQCKTKLLTREKINDFKISGKHKCDLCNTSYTAYINLVSHVHQHTVKSEEMDEDNDGTLAQKDLNDAGSKRNKMKQYSCTKCEAVFKSRYNFKRHLLEVHERVHVHPKVRHKNCFKCKTTVTNEPFLSVTCEKSYHCSRCGASLMDSRGLRRHIRDVHGVNKRLYKGKRNYQYKGNSDGDKLSPGDENITEGQTIEETIQCKYCHAILNRRGGGNYKLKRHLLEVHQGLKIQRTGRIKLTDNRPVHQKGDGGILASKRMPIPAKLLTCIKCDTTFNSVPNLRRHLNDMHANELEDVFIDKYMKQETDKNQEQENCQSKRFTCSKCGMRLRNIANVREHYNKFHLKKSVTQILYRSCVQRAKIHKSIGFFRCDTCNATCRTLLKLKYHICDHIGRVVDDRKNTLQRKQFVKTRRILSSVTASHNHNNSFNHGQTKKCDCQFCGKTFSSADKLRNHVILHEGKMGYRCFACHKSFLCRKYIVQHMDSHIPKTRMECEICHKEFFSVKKLQRHMESNIHVTDCQHLCEICSRSFKTTGALNAHRKTHAQFQPEYVCIICAASYKSLGSLSRHYRVHADTKPYSCSHCPMRFTEKYQLQEHSSIHNPNREKLFTCKICSKAFYSKSALKRHERQVHGGEKRHVCRVCDKYFASISDLSRHVKTHTDERMETCEICGKSFRLKAHLRAHLRVHKGEKLWGCEKCGVRYTDKRSYNRHIGHCTIDLRS